MTDAVIVDVAGGPMGGAARFRIELYHYLERTGRKSVLDLGCGTGDLARELARGGFQVTGCDISAQMLDRAANVQPSEPINWVQLDPDWHTLPFLLDSFDAVVASSVLEYVGDPVSVLRECRRVLRPGGTVLCTVPDITHPVRWLEWAAGMAVRVPLLRSLCARSSRADAYLTYLIISRQRHGGRWWSAAGGRAGLRSCRKPAGGTNRSPLHLVILQRPDGLGGKS